MDIAAKFRNIARRVTDDEAQISFCWSEIEQAYRLPARHYHNMSHIEKMLVLLEEVREACTDPVALELAIFYHDIVYEAQRQDNEVQSAAIAVARLKELGFKHTDKVAALILATQKHEESEDMDTNYLLDIDLSILGMEWPLYREYAEQVREEYRIYPDEIYNPGRVQVLKHFLNLPRIFKTDYYFHKLEEQARQNLSNEIALLT
ncbi:MAG: hypothetical protein BGO31_02720 [Bacteroidetes bacterium 43-16]|nr:MAG: hypothetical protein BGO31_02720 [Bacteroidetes bacterium 43-16]